MQKRSLPQGVEIDHCEQHGVWLDRGELEALLRREGPATAHGGFGSTLERAGERFGRSVVTGAGATMGHRLMNSVIDSVFGRR